MLALLLRRSVHGPYSNQQSGQLQIWIKIWAEISMCYWNYVAHIGGDLMVPSPASEEQKVSYSCATINWLAPKIVPLFRYCSWPNKNLGMLNHL